MRKFRKQVSIIALAMLFITCTGCEKKAVVVEGFKESSDKKIEAVKEETTTDKTTFNEEEYLEEKGISELDMWNEKLEGSSSGFENIDVSVKLKDYSKKELGTTIIEYEDINADYAKKMCDMVFDTDEVEVYDYSKKTKKVCEDQLKTYEETLEIYDYYVEQGMEDAFKYYPDKMVTYGGTEVSNWILEQPSEKMQREEIEEDIERIQKEKEAAPESLENNYSYGGYLGKINGEEYYMYFGNRNYNEYVSSPYSTQCNGRVCTIMKRDLESAYGGDKISDLVIGDINAVGISVKDDSPLFRMNCITSESEVYGEKLSGEDFDISDEKYNSNFEISDDMLDKAKAFLGKLGYNDDTYQYMGYENLMWSNYIDEAFMYANDYHMSSYPYACSDGFVVRFGLNPSDIEFLSSVEVQFPMYVDSGDTFEYNSYIEVYVNENGILGCRINNPAKIMKTDSIKSIIDNATVQDIVRDSVNDRTLWNLPTGRTINLFKVDEIKLINFPVKAQKNKNEYTLIPCYVVFQPLGRNISNVDNPFLLINAIDGSVVKVDKELTDYPKGWDNGNIGYANLMSGQWNRDVNRGKSND